MIMASARNGGGHRLQYWDGLQLQVQAGYGHLLVVALLFVASTNDVQCSITAAVAPASDPPLAENWPGILAFDPHERNTLDTIHKIWGTLNPQLSTGLHWSPERHPCDNQTNFNNVVNKGFIQFQGTWLGVYCNAAVLDSNASGNYYEVSVATLSLYGDKDLCTHDEGYYQCGLGDGIIGQLPAEISKLTKLQGLYITNHRHLTGPVPVEIFQMPSLLSLDLSNNSLEGTLPSHVYTPDCQLGTIQLNHNNFSGDLQVSSEGTLFCSAVSTLSISNNKLTGPFPLEILQRPSLENLDLSVNNLSGSMDFRSLNDTTYLRQLNISNNNFNGAFHTGSFLNPSDMDISNNDFNIITFHIYNSTDNVYMPSLTKLYLGNNNLSGDFPAQILTAENLQILDGGQNQYETLQLPDIKLENYGILQIILTNNKFGSVQYANKGPFTSYNLQYSSLLFLGGNPWCKNIENVVLSSICRFNGSSEALGVVQKSNRKMKIIIATSTASSFAFILVVMSIYVWRLMRRIQALHAILEEFEKKEVKPNLYSYKEIKLATNNFDKDNKLGEGAFGVVYKGELADGTIAAVKKLTMLSNQVLPEFLNEVVVISGLKHRNLVKLKGCCLGDGDQRILVFEYVENKNLAEALWLHGDLKNNIEPPCLDWNTRFNIIVGIARGLAYLHEELQPPIIHRDIKASNILLDNNYNPKIADFGLAYLFPALNDEASHLTLPIAGTRGYLSPEYATNGHVSTALDVYSFGIVVLEIVSGRKSIDLQKTSEEIYLRDWAWKQYEAQESMMVSDPKMEHSSTDLEVMTRVITIALACVHYKASSRPKMHDVVSMLSGKMSINKFQVDFEYGEEIIDNGGECPLTLDTSSSLWSNENLHVR